MIDGKFNDAKYNNKNGLGMNDQELKCEKRRQHALERLGTNTPRCVECGETDWRCLEVHHIAGRDFDDGATVILCRNCHRKLSDDQKDHPKAASSPPNQIDRAGHFLLGLANFFDFLAEKCLEYGLSLTKHAKTVAEDDLEARS
ncbi:MAG: hypothetical protein ABSD11_18960 [Methylocella sp.]|jgi:hypothetical protein